MLFIHLFIYLAFLLSKRFVRVLHEYRLLELICGLEDFFFSRTVQKGARAPAERVFHRWRAGGKYSGKIPQPPPPPPPPTKLVLCAYMYIGYSSAKTSGTCRTSYRFHECMDISMHGLCFVLITFQSVSLQALILFTPMRIEDFWALVCLRSLYFQSIAE